MFLDWGPELVFLYNDALRRSWPSSIQIRLGRSFREVLCRIWEQTSFHSSRSIGRKAITRRSHLVMERNGYPGYWYSFSYSPVRDESGGVAGMFCAAHETTHKCSAAALARSGERLRFVIDGASDYRSSQTDPERRITSWSTGASNIFGYSVGRRSAGAPMNSGPRRPARRSARA